MEHAKKMILVTEEEHDQRGGGCVTSSALRDSGGPGASATGTRETPSDTVQTPGDPISRLDVELSNILRSNKFTDDREKWKRYLQVLQRYMYRMDASRRDVVEPAATRLDNADESPLRLGDAHILNSVPAMFKRKARSLVEYLQNSEALARNITWDKQGAVSIGGVPVHGGNIIDLVNDAVRSRKTFRATGRSQFIDALRAASVPREFIGNDELWKSGGVVTPTGSDRGVQQQSAPVFGGAGPEKRNSRAVARRGRSGKRKAGNYGDMLFESNTLPRNAKHSPGQSVRPSWVNWLRL